MLRRLLQTLLNQPQMISWLSETRPIRSAARFVASVYLRGKTALEHEIKRGDPAKFVSEKSSEAAGKLKSSSFGRTFREELRKGMKEFQEKQRRMK